MRKRLLLPLVFILSITSCSNGIKIEHNLNLPEEYYVEIKVVQNSKHGEVETRYALSESTDGWIYMKLGYDYEQYAYMPLDQNKYIEYKYDTESKKYKATMISDSLQEQIDKGNVTLDSVATSIESVNSRRSVLDNYLIPYATMGSIFTREEDTIYMGRTCETYTGKINVFFSNSDLKYVIDPITGLTMYMENNTTTWFVEASQINDCVAYQETANIPAIE